MLEVAPDAFDGVHLWCVGRQTPEHDPAALGHTWARTSFERITWDKAGLSRVQAEIDERRQNAVLDTGAEFSTIG